MRFLGNLGPHHVDSKAGLGHDDSFYLVIAGLDPAIHDDLQRVMSL
jgi:hypothetical protein